MTMEFSSFHNASIELSAILFYLLSVLTDEEICNTIKEYENVSNIYFGCDCLVV